MRNIEGCKTFAAVISLSFILPGLAVAKDQALERKKNKTPVELLMQVEQLRNETQILRGLVEELTKKIETIEGAFEEKHTDLNSRLTKIFEAQKKAIESAESAVLSQKNNNLVYGWKTFSKCFSQVSIFRRFVDRFILWIRELTGVISERFGLVEPPQSGSLWNRMNSLTLSSCVGSCFSASSSSGAPLGAV